MEPVSFNVTAPTFNGDNYPIWAVKMKTDLRVFDLWDVVEVGGEVPVMRR